MLLLRGQSGLGNDGNEGVLRIPQSSSITGTSPECLVSYPGHTLAVGGSYSSAEKQSVYSTASAYWASRDTIGVFYDPSHIQASR